MHSDHWDAERSTSLVAKLLDSPLVQIGLSGLDVVNRNDLSHFIPQHNAGPNCALLAVPRVLLRIRMFDTNVAAQIPGPQCIFHRSTEIVVDRLPVFRPVPLSARIYELPSTSRSFSVFSSTVEWPVWALFTIATWPGREA